MCSVVLVLLVAYLSLCELCARWTVRESEYSSSVERCVSQGSSRNRSDDIYQRGLVLEDVRDCGLASQTVERPGIWVSRQLQCGGETLEVGSDTSKRWGKLVGAKASVWPSHPEELSGVPSCWVLVVPSLVRLQPKTAVTSTLLFLGHRSDLLMDKT